MTEHTPSAEDWYADSEVIDIREYKISVKKKITEGKPWLVLLHGFPTCMYDWYKMWPQLSEQYSLIAFDFIGFGRSSKPYPHRYSIIEQAEITLALLADQNISSCYILAHDYAVSVTQEIISRIQDNRCTLHVKKIIFLNGGLFPEMHRPVLMQKLLLSPVGKFVNMAFGKSSLQKNLSKVFGPDTQLTQRELDELWSLINYNKGQRVFHLLIKYILDRRENRDRWVKHMQETSIPMLLVNGPLDPVSGRHLEEYYKEIIPDPNTHSLDNIGHYPNLEAPQEVIDQATLFFC